MQLSDPDLYSPTNKERLKKLEFKDTELNEAIKLAETIWIEITNKMEKKIKN